MDYLQKCKETKGEMDSNVFKNDIYCINNSRGQKRFYYNNQTKKHPFIGYERDINQCLEATRNNIDISKLCIKPILTRERKNELRKLFDYIDLLETHTNTSYNEVNEKIFEFLKELITLTNINKNSLDEILNGAFTIINDGGYFFNKYEGKGVIVRSPVYVHMSSHWSNDEQHRNGDAYLYNLENKQNTTFDLLMGTSVLPDFQGNTWFQFENSRTTTLATKAIHSLDFINYLNPFRETKNIGPFGKSEHIELAGKGPLLLDKCNIENEEECIFINSNPIENSENYWKNTPINIANYNQLCKIIYNIGHRNPLRSGLRYEKSDLLNIHVKIEQIYKEIIKNENLSAIREKIKNIEKLKKYSKDYDLEKEYRPDDLVMIVYDIILKTLNDTQEYEDDIDKWLHIIEDENFDRERFAGSKNKKSRKRKSKKSKKSKKKYYKRKSLHKINK